jgi:hypothetical protein
MTFVSDDHLDHALVLLDELADLLELLVEHGTEHSEAAKYRIASIRQIRSDLRSPDLDPPNLRYGEGEWLSDLAWLLSSNDLVAMKIASRRRKSGP